jgi:aspartyl-tRNA(Asn)/glutamyl-tRNA(Gln) amidotransferase subunit B
VEEGSLPRPKAKEFLEIAASGKGRIPELIRTAEAAVLREEDALWAIARETLESHPQAVEDFRAGKTQALGFLVGQAMKRSEGRADPKRLAQILLELLKG